MALPLIKNPLPKDPSKSNAVFLYPCASAELINRKRIGIDIQSPFKKRKETSIFFFYISACDCST